MTTIWLGVTRQGPWAPAAFQFGKYDIFTSTGWPTRSTSKEMRSSVILTLLTVTGATGCSSGWAASICTRGHSLGPLAANGMDHRLGSRYQATDAFSHGLAPG